MLGSGHISSWLRMYQQGKQTVQYGVLGSMILQGGNPGQATQMGADAMNTLSQLESYLGADRISENIGFRVDEAIIAAYGYHPTLSRGDVLDRVLLGDAVHNFFEINLGQGIGDTISGAGSSLYNLFASDLNKK